MEYVKEGKGKVRELREKFEESKEEMVRLEKVEERGEWSLLNLSMIFLLPNWIENIFPLIGLLLMIASKFRLGLTC